MTEGRGQVLYYHCCVIVVILFFSTYPASNLANTGMCMSGFFLIIHYYRPFRAAGKQTARALSCFFLIRFLLQYKAFWLLFALGLVTPVHLYIHLYLEAVLISFLWVIRIYEDAVCMCLKPS